MKILIFTIRYLSLGYGVDLVISQQTKIWKALGYNVIIATLVSDIFEKNKIIQVSAEIESILATIKEIQPNIIFIHTYPFWDFVDSIKENFHGQLVAFDHGDPTLELINDEKEKQFLQNQFNIRKNKIEKFCDRVICISDFIKRDIGYTKSEIVYHGIEHISYFPPKINKLQGKFKIGGLGRLGLHENNYKGIYDFIELTKLLPSDKFEFHYAGHGTEEDVVDFKSLGIIIHLNITNKERDYYYRSLDVFISTSYWEGFNLPLAEAQSTGTLAIAYDVGAHPEVTPFVFSSLDQIKNFIVVLEKKRNLLLKYSRVCYNFVHNQFSWYQSAILAIQHEKLSLLQIEKNTYLMSYFIDRWKIIKRIGFSETIKLILKKLSKKMRLN